MNQIWPLNKVASAGNSVKETIARRVERKLRRRKSGLQYYIANPYWFVGFGRWLVVDAQSGEPVWSAVSPLAALQFVEKMEGRL